MAWNRNGTWKDEACSVGHNGKKRGGKRVRVETDMRSRSKMWGPKWWAESTGIGSVAANNGVNGHRSLTEKNGWIPEGRMPDAFPDAGTWDGCSVTFVPRYTGPMVPRRRAYLVSVMLAGTWRSTSAADCRYTCLTQITPTGMNITGRSIGTGNLIRRNMMQPSGQNRVSFNYFKAKISQINEIMGLLNNLASF